MSHSWFRLLSSTADLQSFKLRATHNVMENITLQSYRRYFQTCNRQAINWYQRRPSKFHSRPVMMKYSQHTQSSASSLRSSDQIVLFSNDNTKFLKIVNLFGYSFAGFWFFTAYQFATMRITPAAQRNSANLPWYVRFDLVSSQATKIIATALTGFLGCAILGGSWMYSLRSVGKLILGKGGKSATFITYNPMTFSMNKATSANIHEISCQGHRSTNDIVPIKIKGYGMHFLLSRDGVYHNGPLFDRSVGLRRSL